MGRYDIKIVHESTENGKWHLALSVKDNNSGMKQSFYIRTLDEKPKFDVVDVKTPKTVDSTFNKIFTKNFGTFSRFDMSSIERGFALARGYQTANNHDMANKILKEIALSLYWNEEHGKFVEQAKAHFSGIDFNNFMAEDYAKAKNDPDITPRDIVKNIKDLDNPQLKEIPLADIEKKVEEVENKISTLVTTTDKYRISGEKHTAQYTEEREKLHIEILNKLITDNLEKYIPQEGEKPTFILLGGRGGSGKSKFKNLVYDDNFIVLDADKIKEMLPEYKGWNAAEVHEESSDILEQALLICQDNGLNVVVDATMDTDMSAVRRLQLFKEAGYETEAHYMFLPPQKSAQRAISRFLTGGETGRYVPLRVLLSMTENEKNFDIIKDHVDTWSFYTGDIDYGEKPILLANKENNAGYMGKRRIAEFYDICGKIIDKDSRQSTGVLALSEKIKDKIEDIIGGNGR